MTGNKEGVNLMIFFTPWIRTFAVINHTSKIALALLTVLTLPASLLLSAGDSAAQTSSSWTYCASEGGQCNFSGTREVRYGANGNYAYGVFTNGVSCNNGVFGDPLYGTGKECEFGDGTSANQAHPAQLHRLTIRHGTTVPARVANVTSPGPGKSVTAPTAIMPMACSPTASAVTTACLAIPCMASLKNANTAMALANQAHPAQRHRLTISSWSYCASEGGQCNFSGTREVRYGANGNYSYGIFANSAGCNNGVFGDPLHGYVKACEIENATTQSTSTTPNPVSTPTATTNTAASYYVGKNGSNSYSCSQARSSSTPKLTIRAALACIGSSPGAGAGQTVEVSAGTYTEPIGYSSQYDPFPSGTSWNAPFTLQARAGDLVTIRSNGASNLQISSSYPQYDIIQGFVFDGTNVSSDTNVGWGDCCQGVSHIRFQNNSIVNNNWTNGMVINSPAHSIEILNNKIHDGSWGGDNAPCGQVHCYTYPIYHSGSNSLFEGNELYNFPSWGIHVYGGSPDHNVFRNNTIHDFGWGDNRSSGILIYSGNANEVYGNVIYNGPFGIDIGGGAHNSSVYNNSVP